LNSFVWQIFLYLRQDIDKTLNEDKHVFSLSKLHQVLRSIGFNLDIYPNQGYINIHQSPDTFIYQFRHNFQVNFQFPPETIAWFEQYMMPHLEELMKLKDTTPVCFALAVCKKPLK